MINAQQVKSFWEKRGEKFKSVPFEAIANLEEDPALLALKIKLEKERVLPRLALNKNMRVLDLGAGVGQWTFRFAPLVKHVTAVEYTKELTEIGIAEAQRRNLHNIEFIISPAEEFSSKETYDLVFISGLFVYLTDRQAANLLKNLKSFVHTKNEVSAGKIFLRDGTSILNQRYCIENKFSDVLKTDYSAVYRTREEYITLFYDAGFVLTHDDNMFPEDCPLNKYPETRLRIYQFILGEEQC